MPEVVLFACDQLIHCHQNFAVVQCIEFFEDVRQFLAVPKSPHQQPTEIGTHDGREYDLLLCEQPTRASKVSPAHEEGCQDVGVAMRGNVASIGEVVHQTQQCVPLLLRLGFQVGVDLLVS